MKILVFSHEFPPYVGGAGVVSLELVKGLTAMGCEITLVKGNTGTKKKYQPLDNELRAMGVRVIGFPFGKRTWFILWPLWFSVMLLNRKKYDHLILATFTSFVAASRLPVSWLGPFTFILHGGDIDVIYGKRKYSSFTKNFIYNTKRLESFIKKAKNVVSVSHYFKDYIKTNYDLETVVIHNGISGFEEVSQKNDCDHLKMISVGRVIKEKGFDLAYEAYKKLPFEYQIPWTIVGTGDYLSEFNSKVLEDGLDKNIKFLGSQTRSQVIAQMLNADLFLLPSRRHEETFGLVYVEAMSAGCLVIGPDYAAVPEIITHGETGILVNPFDVVNITDELQRAIEKSHSLNYMRLRGKVHAQKEFSTSTMAQKYIQLLEHGE